MAVATAKKGKVKATKVKTTYSDAQKKAWKEERLAEQKQLLEDALAQLQSSEAWEHFVKFGRQNLGRLTLNNALLIWSQKKDATIVWGMKQWEKKGVKVNPGARGLRYFAPSGFYILKDKDGNEMLGPDGKIQRRCFFRIVTGYDISDTDAPEPELQPMVELEGNELMKYLENLEQFARELGYSIEYVENTGDAHGFVDERMWKITVNRNLEGNALVRTIVHELAHVYGNVFYKDYPREEAEVMVESATVMAFGMLGFDVSEASVPYIASWGDSSLKQIEKHMKLVDEMAKKLAEKMGD